MSRQEVRLEEETPPIPDSATQYYQKLKCSAFLTQEKEAQAARVYHTTGDRKAFHALVASCQKWVVRIACGFQSRGLPLSDLIQAGNIALMTGVIPKFDPSKGRLTTYSRQGIEWGIMAAIKQYGRVIRISSEAFDQLEQLNKVVAKLIACSGDRPSLEEIVEAMREQHNIGRNRTVDLIMVSDSEIWSLDAPIIQREDEELSLLDMLADEDGSAEDRAGSREFWHMFWEAMSKLPFEQREAVRLRHVVEAACGMKTPNRVVMAATGKRFSAQMYIAEKQGLTKLREVLGPFAKD